MRAAQYRRSSWVAWINAGTQRIHRGRAEAHAVLADDVLAQWEDAIIIVRLTRAPLGGAVGLSRTHISALDGLVCGPSAAAHTWHFRRCGSAARGTSCRGRCGALRCELGWRGHGHDTCGL